MISEPWQLVSWGWAAGLGLFGLGAPLVILWGWAHAVLLRHRNLRTAHLVAMGWKAGSTELSPEDR